MHEVTSCLEAVTEICRVNDCLNIMDALRCSTSICCGLGGMVG